ncbi:hypothetical protein UFOVP1130_91 [uncultured Caudovirales phage]|uniref:Uncharacterized protein n=1 Tax=uncultured Caudovirales phage TaxID=2100421 RepID=A0A6J5QSZ8_9CAUD|nr:hypothetical protein UFOVP1130_91 [uncultured Caudovirales phage]
MAQFILALMVAHFQEQPVLTLATALAITPVMNNVAQVVTVLVVQEVVVVVVTPMVVLLQWQGVVTLLVTITVVVLRLPMRTCMTAFLVRVKPAVTDNTMTPTSIHTILLFMNAFREWFLRLQHGPQELLPQQRTAILTRAILTRAILTRATTLQVEQTPQLQRIRIL